jgi:hypothetical protein
MDQPYQPPNILFLQGLVASDRRFVQDDLIAQADTFSRDEMRTPEWPREPMAWSTTAQLQTTDEPELIFDHAAASFLGESDVKEMETCIENISFDDTTWDELPAIFRSPQRWPKRSNLHCWNCDQSFTTVPRFIPTYIREIPLASFGLETCCVSIEIGVHGVFCSFSCATSHVNSAFRTRDEIERAEHKLRFLYWICTGKYAIRFVPAPIKTSMQQYGGHLSTTQYRDLIDICEKKITSTSAPTIPSLTENATEDMDLTEIIPEAFDYAKIGPWLSTVDQSLS